MHYLHYLHLSILIGRLLIGALASVQMSVTYKHSKSSPEAPCSYLSVSVAVKDNKNILVAKLTLSGDNLKSLSK